MNKNNVWSLADAGDEHGLEKAIRHVPSCVNVSGWSYLGGRRRGVSKTAEGIWVISEADAVSAPILHFATIQRSLACVILALEHGASADGTVGDRRVTADQIALELGPDWDDIREMILAARRRQNDPLGVVEEDESLARKAIELRALDGHSRMMSSFDDGIVEVEIVFRDSGATTKHTITVPRYISFKTLAQKIEAEVQSRVLLSFRTPKGFDPNAVGERDGTPSPARNRMNSSFVSQQSAAVSASNIDPDEAAWLAEKEERERPKFLELKPRTTPVFLSQTAPSCIARPLAFSYTPQPGMESSTHSHSSKNGSVGRSRSSRGFHVLAGSDLSVKINDINSQKNLPPEKRLEKMMKLLADEEGAEHTKGKKGTISQEKLDQTLSRLYDRSLTKMKQRRDSAQEFENNAQMQLMRRNKNGGGGLSDAQAEAVERLCNGASERKAAKIAEIEERVQESLPKPKEKTLTEEEIMSMGDRLSKGFQEAKAKSVQRVEKQMYGNRKRKFLPSLDDHIASVYTAAVDKKKTAIERIDATHGDFRSKKTAKKLTAAQLKEMGDRLSTNK